MNQTKFEFDATFYKSQIKIESPLKGMNLKKNYTNFTNLETKSETDKVRKRKTKLKAKNSL